MTLRVRFLLPLLALAALAACGGETPPPAPDGGGGATEPAEAAGGDEAELPLSGEVRAFIEEVAELRQLPAPAEMGIRTVTRRGVADAYLGTPTDADRFWYERTTKLYRLLGYLDQDEDLYDIWHSYVEEIRGFYRYEDKTLWVVTESEGERLEDFTRDERETLVHEIIHALQDHHFDLVTTYWNRGWSLDARLAFDAVIEGDATVYTEKYAGQARFIPAGGGRFLLAAADGLQDIPGSVLREFDFPYNAGADWARYVLSNHGVEALNAYLADPPAATALILHPELADTGWEPERLSTLDFQGVRISLAPLGLRSTVLGTLGEFYLLNHLLQDAPYSRDWLRDHENRSAVEAAAGWVGDFYSFYEGVENWVLVVRVRFVSEEDAREFAAAQHAVATRGAEVVVEGAITLATKEAGNVTAILEPVARDVIFAIGTNAEVVRAAVEPLVEG